MDIKAIISYANAQQAGNFQHSRLVDIYSGTLNKYVKAALQEELSSDSFKIASKRVPSINLLQRITDKLSNVYTDIPKRTVEDRKDQDILDSYCNSTDIQNVMAQAEVLLNLNHSFALEPYINSEGTFSVRVLSASEFCVYSDDPINPKNPTHFIKYMGNRTKGKKQVNVYWVYTSSVFLEVDEDGDVYDSRPNQFGVIPFVYCSADSFKLQPNPDNDAFENTILIPKLLADLNFAVQFQSHSLMYGIDVDMKGLKGSPDSFWSIKSEEGSDKKPQIGVLSPSVDTEKVISLIQFTVEQWLESKGIKPGSAGNTGSASAVSAVAKIVDEADTSAVISANRILLVRAEKNLWKLIGVIHNALLGLPELAASTGLTAPFQVSISFPVQQIVANPQEQRDQLLFQLENKLISKKRALKHAHPDLSDEELVQLQAEIDAESATPPLQPNQPNQP